MALNSAECFQKAKYDSFIETNWVINGGGNRNDICHPAQA